MVPGAASRNGCLLGGGLANLCGRPDGAARSRAWDKSAAPGMSPSPEAYQVHVLVIFAIIPKIHDRKSSSTSKVLGAILTIRMIDMPHSECG